LSWTPRLGSMPDIEGCGYYLTSNARTRRKNQYGKSLSSQGPLREPSLSGYTLLSYLNPRIWRLRWFEMADVRVKTKSQRIEMLPEKLGPNIFRSNMFNHTKTLELTGVTFSGDPAVLSSDYPATNFERPRSSRDE
jgi:hypothetical protein